MNFSFPLSEFLIILGIYRKGKKRMTQDIWNEWINNFEWIINIAKRRHWDYEPLNVQPTVPAVDITVLEAELGLEYPSDFKEVLIRYSGAVHLSWHMGEDNPGGIYREIFCGGGRGYLWDFDRLKDNYDYYLGWMDAILSEGELDKYDKIWQNKIPFINVLNGDMIAFGEATEQGHPVIYLSHENDELHGCPLGHNFVDFISRWSNIGCVGTEDWQFEPFYDFKKRELKTEGREVERWKEWLS